MFTLEDEEEVTFSHENAWLSLLSYINYNVHKVFVDDGSVMNIFSKDALIQIGMDTFKLILVKNHLIEIKERKVLVKGALDFSMTIDTYLNYCMLPHIFMMIKIYLMCNVMLGRPLLHEINAIINTNK
jgi:hypothetical protein